MNKELFSCGGREALDLCDEGSPTLKQIGFSRIVRCTFNCLPSTLDTDPFMVVLQLSSGRVYVCFDERFQASDIVKKSATEKKTEIKAFFGRHKKDEK